MVLLAGKFSLHFQLPVFSGDNREPSYLETFVTEDLGGGSFGYVHLAEDVRFRHLDFSRFERPLTRADLVEYNSHYLRRHPGCWKTTITQPTWLLSLEAIDRLAELALRRS